MRALQEHCPSRKAFAVAEKRGEPCDDVDVIYLEHNFQGKRGFLASLSENTSFVCLDWFWLQQGYYARYGLNWVTEKIPAAFRKCPKLISVVLPLESWSLSGGGLQEMLDSREGRRALADSRIAFQPLTWKQARIKHPMVAATLLAAKRGHISLAGVHAEERHVNLETPFMVFFRVKAEKYK
jgi:hypothetical protein